MTEKLPAPKPLRNHPVGSDARIAVRRMEAMNLRLQGMSFVKIGQALGVSDKTAAADIQFNLHELAKLSKESAESFRQMELERLDQLLSGLWGRAIKGDNWSVDRCLSICELRSKLLGLFVPVQHIMQGNKENPVEIAHKHSVDEQLMARMKRLAGLDQPLDAAEEDDAIDITP